MLQKIGSHDKVKNIEIFRHGTFHRIHLKFSKIFDANAIIIRNEFYLLKSNREKEEEMSNMWCYHDRKIYRAILSREYFYLYSRWNKFHSTIINTYIYIYIFFYDASKVMQTFDFKFETKQKKK